MRKIVERYEEARERYQELGVDTEQALDTLASIPVSMHCWQGDDVQGFLFPDQELSGGIQATGSYPGAARTPEELRSDMEEALRLIPGTRRVNLHAIYADTPEKVDLDELEPHHFSAWVDWAREQGLGLDFNPTCFSHEKAADGFTLSSPDLEIRKFWIEHCIRCRKIGEYFGRELGSPCVTNIWIPDGYKDTPANRLAPRERLLEALDQILQEAIDPRYNLDALESKVFGIGSESYVTGSHEFYMGYAVRHNTLLTLDTGHFHPTEMVSNKISAILLFLDQMLLHVSRPVRWDSDHIVALDGELVEIAHELVRGGYWKRVHIGLDYFDASVNRIAAWVIGMRNMQKALLYALLEPVSTLQKAEEEGDFTKRIMLLEELKSMPWESVWDYYCEKQGVPVGIAWMEEVLRYEKEELAGRKVR